VKNCIVLFSIIAIMSVSSCTSQAPESALQTSVAEAMKGTQEMEELVDMIMKTEVAIKESLYTSTPSPLPTNTLVPSLTPIPEPKQFSGSGNVELSLQDVLVDSILGGIVLHIKGPDSDDVFRVIGFNANGEVSEILVDTAESYDAFLVLEETPARISIESVGDWTVVVYPITVPLTKVVEVPGLFNGDGNQVLGLNGDADEVLISTTSQQEFVVITHGVYGSQTLFNIIGSANESAEIPPETWLLEIQTTGTWTVEIIDK